MCVCVCVRVCVCVCVCASVRPSLRVPPSEAALSEVWASHFPAQSMSLSAGAMKASQTAFDTLADDLLITPKISPFSDNTRSAVA